MALQTRNRFVKISIKRDTAPVRLADTMPMTLVFVGATMPHTYFSNAEEAKEALKDLFDEGGEAVSDTVSMMFSQRKRHEVLGLVGVADEGGLTALLAQETPFEDSYRIASEGLTTVGHNEIAEYVEGKALLYYPTFYSTAEYEEFYEAQQENDNVAAFVHDTETENLGAGAAALASGNFFGDWWVEFNKINGITPNTFTTQEINDLLDKNASVYIRESRKDIVTGSKVMSGEYIDIVETEHYLVDKIIDKMFSILTTGNKIPYTQKGIDSFDGGLRNVLDNATNKGVLATDENDNPVYSVSAPLRAEVDTKYIKNRILPDLKFTAVPSGAIGKVEISGLLTFDMEEVR